MPRPIIPLIIGARPAVIKPASVHRALLTAAQRQMRWVLTDNGGIRRETPCFPISLPVLREQVERPETVKPGMAKLAGTSHHTVAENVVHLQTGTGGYGAMRRGIPPPVTAIAANASRKRRFAASRRPNGINHGVD